jgi:hypothetical protein
VLIGVSRADWRRPTDNIRRGPRQQCFGLAALSRRSTESEKGALNPHDPLLSEKQVVR